MDTMSKASSVAQLKSPNGQSNLQKRAQASGSLQASPQKHGGSNKLERTGTNKVSANPQGELQVAYKQIKEYEIEINHLRATHQVNENAEDIVGSLKQEIELLQERLRESENARINLQDQLVSAAQIDKDTSAKDDKYKSLIIKENEELRGIIAKKDNELREKDSRIDYLRQIINENELEKQEMKIIVEETLSKHSGSETTVYESEMRRIALQNEYEKCLDEYNEKLRKHYEIIENLTKENETLKQRIRDLEAQISQLAQQQIETLTLLKQEQDKSKKVTELEKIIADLKQQRDLLMKHLEQMNKEKDQLFEKYKKLQQETESLLLRMREEFTKFEQIREQLEKELFEKDEELVKKDAIIKNLTTKQLEMSEQIQKFQKYIEAQKDLRRQLEQLSKENEQLRDQKNHLEQSLQDSNKLLEDNAFGGNDASNRIKELQDKIREQQEELEAMKQLVHGLRSRYQIYIPDKEDPVDIQLAEYINNYPERSNLRIMFMKESSGVYQFGSRRVYCRVERDKISVRVGGGYLSIDEFLDIYTPMELERLERNDPIKKFSEKVAVQKTLSMVSPVRSPGPQKRDLSQSNGQTLSNSKPQLLNIPGNPQIINEKKRMS